MDGTEDGHHRRLAGPTVSPSHRLPPPFFPLSYTPHPYLRFLSIRHGMANVRQALTESRLAGAEVTALLDLLYLQGETGESG